MADRKRCCCNCGNCLRVPDPTSGVNTNYCAIDMHYIGYIETFEGWCRRWKKDRKWDEEPIPQTDEIDFDYEAED